MCVFVCMLVTCGDQKRTSDFFFIVFHYLVVPRKSCSEGWEDSSIGKMFVVQGRGLTCSVLITRMSGAVVCAYGG